MLKTIESIINAPVKVVSDDTIRKTYKRLTTNELKNAVTIYHEPEVTFDNETRTGDFTPELKALADIIENATTNPVSIHADPKKRKLMIRRANKMLFKVFIQKNGYKLHLKHSYDFKAFGIDTEPTYQNGFNLPYMLKDLSIDTVKMIAEHF